MPNGNDLGLQKDFPKLFSQDNIRNLCLPNSIRSHLTDLGRKIFKISQLHNQPKLHNHPRGELTEQEHNLFNLTRPKAVTIRNQRLITEARGVKISADLVWKNIRRHLKTSRDKILLNNLDWVTKWIWRLWNYRDPNKS